jgi:ABC-type dipeptide/oligopeptide/nickel transport system permease component
VVQGITLMIAVLAIVVNLVVDLLCMAIDPRIRRGVAVER